MRFILKTSLRYAFSRRSSQRTTSIMLFLAIAVSTLVMFVSLGVMNGLQTSQLDALRALESFDLKIYSDVITKDELHHHMPCTVYEVDELSSLLSTENSSQTLRVRAIDKEYFDDDRVVDYIRISSELKTGLVVSNITYGNLYVNPGEQVSFTYLKKGKTATLVPFSTKIPVSGLYASKLSDFSSSTAFIPRSEITDSSLDHYLGVFTELSSEQAKKIILSLDENAEVVTWQSSNSALYSALMLEKTLMVVFLLCIFIIIFTALRNATSRLIRTKSREGAVLMALGLTRRKLSLVFLLESLVVVIIGLILGTAFSLLLIHNMDKVLVFLSLVFKKLTGRSSILGLISLDVFISAKEIILICMTALLLSVVFVYSCCHSVYKKSVREVLLDAGN